MKTRWPKTMTVAEFQERIRQQCGAPAIRPTNPLLTRKPTDRGFDPPIDQHFCEEHITHRRKGCEACDLEFAEVLARSLARVQRAKTKQNGGKNE